MISSSINPQWYTRNPDKKAVLKLLHLQIRVFLQYIYTSKSYEVITL
jgi:hypothetical protein